MKSEVMGLHCWPSAAAIFSVNTPTNWTVWTVIVLLLLILTQVVSSLMLHAGVFILSSEVLVSPFRVCLAQEHGGEVNCYAGTGAETEVKTTILSAVVILGLYVPVVLVAFALLAVVLSAYSKERAALGFSAVCQAASSLLILTGIIGFLLQHQVYVSWGNMTLWFYVCVCVQAELLLSAALTCVSQRSLKSDWR
ncbi:hypothetical protein JOB18_048020 [Solea senegalensis]|uniref:Uncharacterized protein n=1 Tax=Solea senegalensis TaxID=28829 RepID=A0AAV6T250_SOLSE|nr:uncharacterized protein LOC122776175 isoform X2 [Solea senegalensis]XP_043892510.1 uncharacterized protein LOC122776175 isoform X2 [Solea senegalensis]KAG7523480.1 hypothetical protein JOB18_048020 [Solea senegalensis]